MLAWLQDHLLPCPFKYLTGIDCLGCGFQRAVLALLHGNVKQSFIVYPPGIAIVLLVAYYFTTRLIPQKSSLLNPLIRLTGVLILVNYSFKIWELLVG